MRKTLRISYPFNKVEGIYCLEPCVTWKSLSLGDFKYLGDRQIVEVLKEEVVIKDLSGFLPWEEYGQEDEWAYRGRGNPCL
jgi:hypothetical protein